MLRKRARGRHRNAQGSMLVLTILVMFLFVLLFTFFLLLIVLMHNRVRQENLSDQSALTLAKLLNKDNRVGQLNEMTACTRQMVFKARSHAHQTLDIRMKGYGPLANQVLSDTRQSAGDFLEEHDRQIEDLKTNIKNTVHKINYPNRSESSFDNVILKAQSQITDVEVGYLDHVQSSTQPFDESIPELFCWNAEQNYVHEPSKLFRGNINAILPYDDDLKFRLSSLPTAVEGHVAPPRLANFSQFHSLGKIIENGVYRKIDLQFIPSAVKVTQRVEINTPLCKQVVVSTSVASTNGAMPPPWFEREENPQP